MTDQIATATDIEFADSFYNYHIRGVAREDEQQRYFCVPLISHVEGNLWQGGWWPQVLLPEAFVNVFNLYGLSYELGPHTVEHKYVMHDTASQGFDQVDEIAQEVVEALDVGPTLVHCQAGLNRSGLVAARALMLMGDSSVTAIAKLRRRAPMVLCNQSFANWLHGLD